MKARKTDIVKNIEAGNVVDDHRVVAHTRLDGAIRYQIEVAVWQADCNGPSCRSKIQNPRPSAPEAERRLQSSASMPTSTIRTAITSLHISSATITTVLPRACPFCIIGHQDYTHRGLDNEQKRQIRPVAQLRWLYGPWRGQPPRQRLLDSESLAAKSCKCLQQPFADNQDRLPRRPKYQSGNPGLEPLAAYGITGGRDYEKVESARLLSSNEYILNSTLGYISIKSALGADEVLAVAYEYTYNGQVYTGGRVLGRHHIYRPEPGLPDYYFGRGVGGCLYFNSIGSP